MAWRQLQAALSVQQKLCMTTWRRNPTRYLCERANQSKFLALKMDGAGSKKGMVLWDWRRRTTSNFR